jgi:mRNA interferase MazF
MNAEPAPRAPMRRGEIWALDAHGAEAAAPVVIVQDDNFDATDSVTICAFTTDPAEAPLFRPRIIPSTLNGLRQVACIMVDKLTTIPRARISHRLGRLQDADVVLLNRAMVVFLGLAVSSRFRRERAP